MALGEAIQSRSFSNVWICMRCNVKNRGSPGKKPFQCRKCGSQRLRLKNKQGKKK